MRCIGNCAVVAIAPVSQHWVSSAQFIPLYKTNRCALFIGYTIGTEMFEYVFIKTYPRQQSQAIGDCFDTLTKINE